MGADIDEFAALIGDEMVSESRLAELFGVTTRTVRELARNGVIVRASTGFAHDESVKSYCAHLRERAAGRSDSGTLTAERVRVAKEQADKLALANAIARREFLPAREVETTWAGILRDVRTRLLAVASRCGASLPHLTAHDVAAIDSEIRKALKDVADASE